MAEQTVKAVMVETFPSILLFIPNNWVLCHQPSTLEGAIVVMEAYASAEEGLYLIPKAWRNEREDGA